MDENRIAPAELPLGAGHADHFRLGPADMKISHVTGRDKAHPATSRAIAEQSAAIWSASKEQVLEGLRRGVRPEHVRRVAGWWALQGGQRGPLHALDAWRIADDAARAALGGEVRL
jgi:hypothetical protein